MLFPALVGRKFGRLSVVAAAPRNKAGKAMLRVVCNCGTIKLVRADDLQRGTTVSCGCKRKVKVHGGCANGTRSLTYRSWDCMIQRCTNPKHRAYPNYGGRGIAVYPPWLDSFTAFLADMGERPADMTLDRINVNESYSPGNCRWATKEVQNNNRRCCAQKPF